MADNAPREPNDPAPTRRQVARFQMPEPVVDVDVASIWSDSPNNSVLMMTHYLGPDIFRGLRQFSTALLLKGTLDPGLRELIILRVGYLSRCEYECYQHEPLARSLGVPQQHLDAVMGREHPRLPPKEQSVVNFVDELVHTVRPSDARLTALRQHFADAGILEITTIAGFYMMMARTIETMGVPIDAHTIADARSS